MCCAQCSTEQWEARKYADARNKKKSPPAKAQRTMKLKIFCFTCAVKIIPRLNIDRETRNALNAQISNGLKGKDVSVPDIRFIIFELYSNDEGKLCNLSVDGTHLHWWNEHRNEGMFGNLCRFIWYTDLCRDRSLHLYPFVYPRWILLWV